MVSRALFFLNFVVLCFLSVDIVVGVERKIKGVGSLTNSKRKRRGKAATRIEVGRSRKLLVESKFN